jgi:hypothetical protein
LRKMLVRTTIRRKIPSLSTAHSTACQHRARRFAHTTHRTVHRLG